MDLISILALIQEGRQSYAAQAEEHKAVCIRALGAAEACAKLADEIKRIYENESKKEIPSSIQETPGTVPGAPGTVNAGA